MKEMETQALIREQEKTDLELKLVSIRNAFLQSQINPHLLFNTLNFVYGKVHEVSQPASDVIITLSDIMRYSLVENKQDARVKLSRKIEQIENLIKINQYRFDNNLQLKLKAEGNLEEALIIPLLLVPFVENMFKYADLSDASHTATIHVKVEDNVFEFSAFNKKKKTIHFQSTGIGIQNVKTRLDAYYADQYSLEVRDHDPYFTVSLRIKL